MIDAGVHVPEPGQQVHQRRLAAAVGADQGDGLAVADLQRDALEQGRAARIAEVDVLELDDLGLPRQLDRLGTFDHLGLAIHHGADAVGRGRGALDLGMNVGELADRVGRTGEHGVKGQQLLDRHDLRRELDLEGPSCRKMVFFRTRYEPARSAMATVISVSISRTGSDMASIIATRIALR